jgi:hypothetical protein
MAEADDESVLIIAPVPIANRERLVLVADTGGSLIPLRDMMAASLIASFAAVRSGLRARVGLQVEILAVRRQPAVLQRQAPCRPRLRQVDRLLWVLLSHL